MKNIVIKCCENSKFLRTEAVAKAIEFEDRFMPHKKMGIYNCVLWVKPSNTGNKEWRFVVYHTKTSIVVNVYMSTLNQQQ